MKKCKMCGKEKREGESWKTDEDALLKSPNSYCPDCKTRILRGDILRHRYEEDNDEKFCRNEEDDDASWCRQRK